MFLFSHGGMVMCGIMRPSCLPLMVRMDSVSLQFQIWLSLIILAWHGQAGLFTSGQSLFSYDLHSVDIISTTTKTIRRRYRKLGSPLLVDPTLLENVTVRYLFSLSSARTAVTYTGYTGFAILSRLTWYQTSRPRKQYGLCLSLVPSLSESTLIIEAWPLAPVPRFNLAYFSSYSCFS